MITKKDITCLKGKATFFIETSISLDTFQDIYEEDSEWDNYEDLANDIEEFLFDNIEQTIMYLERDGHLDQDIDYKIKINGVQIK